MESKKPLEDTEKLLSRIRNELSELTSTRPIDPLLVSIIYQLIALTNFLQNSVAAIQSKLSEIS